MLIDIQELEGIAKPELVFGVAAPVGTPVGHYCAFLRQLLERRGYEVETVKLTDIMAALPLSAPVPPPDADEFTRISMLMDRGNALREEVGSGEALAVLATAEINNVRPGPDEGPAHLEGQAFVLRQLKHPDEVLWLRQVYGSSFHLIGINSPRQVREHHLHQKPMEKKQAADLVDRDEGEGTDFGQQLRNTFYRADVFVNVAGTSEAADDKAKDELERYVSLVMGDFTDGLITPTREEYGMFMAHAASLRSADLSRQVGAAVAAGQGGEIVALGCNEVPAAFGGQYWDGDEQDARDFKMGFDSNAQVKREVLEEIAGRIDADWGERGDKEEVLRSIAQKLEGTRVTDLTEFGRAVHAEMEAILAAARVGVSIRGGTLYGTTFPCHNCAKHIVDAGIEEVVYVEPYPKSLARRLHHDSIAFPEDESVEGKVVFRPFVGVAPRRYDELFSMVNPSGRRVARKGRDGAAIKQIVGLRAYASPVTYIGREALAAAWAKAKNPPRETDA